MSIRHPALRYHGGKFRIAPWVISHFPAHATYVEPFGGGAGALLNKPRSYAEVYNDLDGDVVNFFRVLRDPAMRAQLIEQCILTPFARVEFDEAFQHTDDPIERARRICVRAMMGFGSAGATKGSTGFRHDIRRKYGTATDLWRRYPAAIAAAGERMTGVFIEQRPALEILRKFDAPDTLHYVDPPYVHATRAMRTKSAYRHEMTDADHRELLELCVGLQGAVVISGYASPLYSEILAGWQCSAMTVRASSGRGTVLRDELLWCSPRAAQTRLL